jgi:hypothetical protein
MPFEAASCIPTTIVGSIIGKNGLKGTVWGELTGNSPAALGKAISSAIMAGGDAKYYYII